MVTSDFRFENFFFFGVAISMVNTTWPSDLDMSVCLQSRQALSHLHRRLAGDGEEGQCSNQVAPH